MTWQRRFWVKVVRDPETECWWWLGAHQALGYGSFWHTGEMHSAHRTAYELVVGPIPEGLELDHRCRFPRCVNPDHLEPVTHAENLRRSRKLVCSRGHSQFGRTARQCPTCSNEGARRRAAEYRRA